ncbi:PspC domain-containing protein [Daejeonella lutea]|uniref:Phage shock protein C (PspC) family protein n=1 Tax=Daejeonella lutea TaxID=572036 RepID=A0A1T5ESA4_9SPHI|nr:PspC domain-containing protein [Daejeonella lutea]SKB86841.1 phage shock protein C (PspC) family protein [Daejeonella lutea]
MEKKLQRNEQEKSVAGVCAGLAEYFDVDVTWIRIAFVLAVLAGLSGVLAYIVLWIAVPVKPYVPNYGQYTADYKVYDNAAGPIGPINDPAFAGIPYPKKKKSGNGGVVMGIIFVIFGAFFLMDEFHFVPYWFEFHKLWPLVFIIPGIVMITNANKKTWKEEWKEQQAANQAANDAAQQSNASNTEEVTIIADENSKKEA